MNKILELHSKCYTTLLYINKYQEKLNLWFYKVYYDFYIVQTIR